MPEKSLELDQQDPKMNPDNPHNNYLYIWATTGGIGLLAYLWVLWRCARINWIVLRSKVSTTQKRVIALGFGASLVAFLVWCIPGFETISTSVALFAIMALVSVWASGDRISVVASDTKPMLPIFVRVILATVIISMATLMVWQSAIRYRADKACGQGVKAQDKGRFDEAVTDFVKASRINRYESFYPYSQGLALLEWARSLDEKQRRVDLAKQAEACLQTSLLHSWSPENTWVLIADSRRVREDPHGAIQALEQALKWSPHLAGVRATLASLQFKEGDITSAWDNLNLAIKVDPKDPSVQKVMWEFIQPPSRP